MRSILVAAFLSLVLCVSWFSEGFAQSSTEGTPQTAGSRQVVAEGSGGDVRVTVIPGVVKCRSLLSEIARLSGMQIRNLDRVPDDVLYMEATDEPLGSVIGKILAFAKVDYVLRAGDSAGAPLLILAEPTGVTEPTAPDVSADEPDPHLIPLEDAPPATVELGPAPNWQTIEMTPRQVTLPPEMAAPRSFSVSAPPPVPSGPTTPSTTQPVIKH